jgi:uncharacterized membrane protein YgcG
MILLALIAGVLAGCQMAPVDEAAYADAINSDPRVWPPYDPGQAFPPQIMDGESRSGSRSSSRDGGGRDGGGRDGGGRGGGRR